MSHGGNPIFCRNSEWACPWVPGAWTSCPVARRSRRVPQSLPLEACLHSQWFCRHCRAQTLHDCSTSMKMFICGMFPGSRIEGSEDPGISRGRDSCWLAPKGLFIQGGLLLPFRIPLATLPPSPALSAEHRPTHQLTVGIHMISFPTYLIVFPKLLFPLHHLPPTKNPVLYFISTCKDTNYVHSACLCRQSTFSLSLRSCIPLLIDPGLPISDPLGTRFPRRKVPLLSAPP